MSDKNNNLALWNAVEKTDPKHTKGFKRGGGFSGTAISPMYLIYRATEQWGPMGIKWGIRIITEKVVQGCPRLNATGAVLGYESIHMVQCEVFYPGGAIPCFGQTMFVDFNKNGFVTDEEAPKKSLTDALTKGLSWLGFAADVHMGRYDDSKYVAEVARSLKAEAIAEDKAQEDRDMKQTLRDKTLPLLQGSARQGVAALAAAWKLLSKETQRACVDDKDALKAIAEEHDREAVSREPGDEPMEYEGARV